MVPEYCSKVGWSAVVWDGEWRAPFLPCSRMSSGCKISEMPPPSHEHSTVPSCVHYKAPVWDPYTPGVALNFSCIYYNQEAVILTDVYSFKLNVLFITHKCALFAPDSHSTVIWISFVKYFLFCYALNIHAKDPVISFRTVQYLNINI